MKEGEKEREFLYFHSEANDFGKITQNLKSKSQQRSVKCVHIKEN